MARHVETGWLIEHDDLSKSTGKRHWFCVIGGKAAWTEDNVRAVRFTRAQDALAVRSTHPMEQLLSVSEHQWITG
jgi:hypothetical protein